MENKAVKHNLNQMHSSKRQHGAASVIAKFCRTDFREAPYQAFALRDEALKNGGLPGPAHTPLEGVYIFLLTSSV